MHILDKLKRIRNYLGSTRQVGHTQLMIDGVRNSRESIVLALNKHSGEYIERRNVLFPNAHKVVTLHNLDNLIGHRKPMAIDNGALFSLLDEAVSEIEKLSTLSDAADDAITNFREALEEMHKKTDNGESDNLNPNEEIKKPTQ